MREINPTRTWNSSCTICKMWKKPNLNWSVSERGKPLQTMCRRVSNPAFLYVLITLGYPEKSFRPDDTDFTNSFWSPSVLYHLFDLSIYLENRNQTGMVTDIVYDSLRLIIKSEISRSQRCTCLLNHELVIRSLTML